MAAPKKYGKGYTQISENDFKLIKDLQGLGLSKAQAAGITKRSESTISYIYNVDTLAEYKENIRKKYQRQIESGSIKLQEKAVEQPTEQHPTQSDTTFISNAADPALLEALSKINGTLERLVNAWESQPNKKGWLK